MLRYGLATVLLSGILSGCFPGSVTFKPAQLPPAEEVTTPPLNTLTEAYPGDLLMVRTGVVQAKDGFVAVMDYQPADMKVRGELFHFDTIPKGSEWVVIGTLPSGDHLCRNSSYPEPRFDGTRVKGHSALVTTPKGYAYGFAVLTGKEAFVVAWKAQPAIAILKKADVVRLSGPARQELVYSGRSAGIITMTYREYRDDGTEPAATQELSLDLARSLTFQFRGMTLEIKEAPAPSIRYVITSPLR